MDGTEQRDTIKSKINSGDSTPQYQVTNFCYCGY